MQRFKNLLVGIDLSYGEQSISTKLPPPSREAAERALWLAKLNGARVTFFHALDVSPTTRRMIEESDCQMETFSAQAKAVLQELVGRAAGDGISATMDVRVGTSWIEIIRQVLRDNHDLVLAGTRHLSELKAFLMGSTGIKLLRNCPCPVWITLPQPEQPIKSILVSHCLRTVGDLAMELGCSMAHFHGAKLHVIHALEPPEFESAFPARVPAEKMARLRTDAQKHIASQLANHEFAQSPEVHIVTDSAHFAVLQNVQKYEVELLVMGTVARTGVAGFITGNTAERLLPQLSCSVLAVKPPGFVSPVTF